MGYLLPEGVDVETLCGHGQESPRILMMYRYPGLRSLSRSGVQATSSAASQKPVNRVTMRSDSPCVHYFSQGSNPSVDGCLLYRVGIDYLNGTSSIYTNARPDRCSREEITIDLQHLSYSNRFALLGFGSIPHEIICT
jgi:hypothetical protein